MNDHIQIQTTAASKDEAERIAQTLVERRLAACVHVAGPIHSIYRWQAAVEQTEEWTCTAKTRRDLFEQVAAAIGELHSYDCPEVIATAIAAGSADYLAWLDQQLQ